MKPHSKLKMGVGSKIIIGSNAKLIADSAEFTSIDSTKNERIIFPQTGKEIFAFKNEMK